MNRFFSLLWILALTQLVVPQGIHAQEPKPSIFELNKKLGKGINLGNALEAPNEGAWG